MEIDNPKKSRRQVAPKQDNFSENHSLVENRAQKFALVDQGDLGQNISVVK
jgi:hypothetical protein